MSWTNDLQNGSLKSLAQQASSDNNFSYDEMLSILQSAADNGITSSEYTDLKSIYSNAENSFASNYVKTISYSTIYTNPSNSKWWGGVTDISSVQALGNMSAGMSEQKANWLVDKWFLGLDLPMPIAGGDSARQDSAHYVYDYSSSEGTLFANGAAANDVSQGFSGTCYLLAAMGSVANASSTLIESNFIDNGNGTYGVRFYFNNEEHYTTVNTDMPTLTLSDGSERVMFTSNPDHSLEGEMWAALLEKAYAQINSQLETRYAGDPKGSGKNSYQDIEGGWAYPIKQLTNYNFDYYSSYLLNTFDDEKSGLYRSRDPNTYKQTIIDALDAGSIGWLGSFGRTYSDSGEAELVSGHAYMLLGYNSDTDLFTIRNPWGDSGSGYAAEFQAPIEDFWNANVRGVVALSEPITEPEPEPEINYTLSSDAATMVTAADEGESITFTITRDTSGSVSTVYLTTATTGTANQADFNGFDKLAVQFDTHETTKTISVDTFIDNLDEAVEGFDLQLFKNITDLSADTSTIAYIANVESADYSYTISTEADSSTTGVSEGDEVSFTITRSASGTASTVYLRTEDIGTVSGFDYIGLNYFALDFAAYETSKILTIGTYHDSASEGDETFSLNLYENLSDGIIAAEATAYIKDEYLPYYSYSVQSDAGSPDTAVEEGGTVTFTITRSSSGIEATVFVATQASSAGSSDFEHLELQAVTFAADQKVITLEVESNEDWWLESDEYFKLNVYKNATDSTPTAYGAAFITNKDSALYNYSIDNDATVEEGGTITFTITRDGSGSASTVYLNTEDGSATSGDYEQLGQFDLKFSEYETSKTVTLNVFEDFADETDENFWLNLYHNKSDAGYAAQSEVTIKNVTSQTDYNYTITDDSSLFSPTEEGSTVTYVITRDSSGSASTVYLSTTHGTANDGDYNALDKYALEFASYETTKTVTVDIYQDSTAETTEYFWLDLFKSYANAEKGRYDAYADAYIKNVDGADTETYDYTISSDAGYGSPATEGEYITLTVTRSGTGSESTVYVQTHDGTAKNGFDYKGHSQAVVFAEYETSKTITLHTHQDNEKEYPEHFWASVYNGDPSVPGAGKALDSTLNYIQDTAKSNFEYIITSDDRKVSEGESITYTITRDGSGYASTVYLQTEDAGASSGSDYAGLSDYSLNFATYETEKSITIDTYLDSETEFIEGFWLQLFTTVGDIEQNNYAAYNWGQIEDGTDPDAPDYNYTLTCDSTESDPALEGDSLTFTIIRNNSGSASTVYLKTEDGTATGGPDYDSLSSYAVDFAEYETSKTITINSYQDSNTEGVESFGLELYKNQSDLQTSDIHAWANGYIDDQPIKQYSYTIDSDNTPVTEGEALSFTITRDGSGTEEILYLNTKSGTALEGSDFEELNLYSVYFADYETSKTITLDTYQDSYNEGEEYLFLEAYTSVSNALNGDYTAYSIAHIKDPEQEEEEPEYTYTLSPSVMTVDEDGKGVWFELTRNGSGTESTVYFKTNDGTAIGGLDYGIYSGHIDFPRNSTALTTRIGIDVFEDDLVEDIESFSLEIYTSQADLLSGNVHTWGTAYIVDTTEQQVEYSYTLEVENSPAIEGEALSFTITRDGNGTESSVFLGSTNGTAQAGDDFDGVSAEEINFAADETSKTFTLATFEDFENESNETLWLNLYETYTDTQSNNIDSYVVATIANKAVITDFNYTISSDSVIDNPTAEGNSISFTIARDNSGIESTVFLSTSDSTTLGELDYETLSGYELTFAVDETSKTITLDTYLDSMVEDIERFSLVLYKSQADMQARDHHVWHTAAIKDTATANFSYALTSINSPVQEGEDLIFEIHRNGSGAESTVYISTSDGDATAGSDYSGLSLQAVEFGENETTKTISVNTLVDGETEGDEYFWVDLFKTQTDVQNNVSETSSWVVIQDGSGDNTDQNTYYLTSESPMVIQGDSMTYTVTRDNTDSTASVFVNTKDLSALYFSYEDIGVLELQFSPGEAQKTFTLDTYLDIDPAVYNPFDLDGAYTVSVYSDYDSALNQVYENQITHALDTTIFPVKNESQYSISSTATETTPIKEGETATFTIERIDNSSAASVYLRTVSTTATRSGQISDHEYDSISPYAQLDFSAGESSKTISLDIYPNDEQDANTALALLLSEQEDSPAITWALAYVEDDTDDTYTYTLNSNHVNNAAEGEFVIFTISREGGDNIDHNTDSSTIYLQTKDGQASSGSDYQALSAHPVTFHSNSESQTVVLEVFSDNQTEGAEDFLLEVYTSTNNLAAGIAHTSLTQTIMDTLEASPQAGKASAAPEASVLNLENLEPEDSITFILGNESFTYAGNAAETAYSLFQYDLEPLSSAANHQDFVETVYQNLFNRAPDVEGWSFWEAQLESGLTENNFLRSFINGAYADTSGDEDRGLLDNMYEVATYFTKQFIGNALENNDSGINTLLDYLSADDNAVESAIDVIDYAFNNDVTLSGIMEDQALFEQVWGIAL